MIKNQWYIICFEDELKEGAHLHRRIVGEDIVIFKTKNGVVSALEDRCCHRNVKLSLGYVSNENIKCGYHGWEFATDGKCVHIPVLGDEKQIYKNACIKAYPFQKKHKAYWIFIGEKEEMERAQIPDLWELDSYPFVYNSHVFDADIKLVAESLFDAQHINHVHRKTIKNLMGKLQEPKTEYTLQINSDSLSGSYERINNASFFEKFYFGFSATVHTKFAFWFPHTSKLAGYYPAHLFSPKRELVIYEHFYEVDEGKVCMIQITAWKNIFSRMPYFDKWFMRNKSDKIVAEDIDFLASNKNWHQQKELHYMIIKEDEVSVAFLQLWNKNKNKHNDKTVD